MRGFDAQLWEADHVVFDAVTGIVDCEEQENAAGATGRFEIHQGGILAGNAMLGTDREYRLVFADGRSWPIRLTKMGASNSAGIASVEFRVAEDTLAETQAGMAEV